MSPERSVHWLGDELQAKVAALLDYAESIDVPILSLAFSWLLSHDVGRERHRRGLQRRSGARQRERRAHAQPGDVDRSD